MKLNKINNKVAIIMGSQSDYPVMKDAEKILKLLKINYEVLIVSAHRTPKRMFEFAENAEKKGFDIYFIYVIQREAVSYTHLTLPTKA